MRTQAHLKVTLGIFIGLAIAAVGWVSCEEEPEDFEASDSDSDTDSDADTEDLPGLGETCVVGMAGYIGMEGVCQLILEPCDSGLIPNTDKMPLCQGGYLVACCVHEDECESLFPGITVCYDAEEGCPEGVQGYQVGCPASGWCCFGY